MKINDRLRAHPNVTTGQLRLRGKIYVKQRRRTRLVCRSGDFAHRGSRATKAFPVYDTIRAHIPITNVPRCRERGTLARAIRMGCERRGGIEDYEGASVTAEDNGNVSAQACARQIPHGASPPCLAANGTAGDPARRGPRRRAGTNAMI